MTDIRKGDLVKATRKDNPDVSVTTRILAGNNPRLGYYSASLGVHLPFEDYDWEVLEREDDELIKKVRRAYTNTTSVNDQDWKAVIEAVRQHDGVNAR